MSISPERVLEEGGESVWSVALACWVSFFFSSRRRHTRFDCDWSSDVCSSDLIGLLVQGHIAVESQQHDTRRGDQGTLRGRREGQRTDRETETRENASGEVRAADRKSVV